MNLQTYDYECLGGSLISHAKAVKIAAVGEIYPQHYYTYSQTLESLSKTLSLIQPPEGILLFCGNENGGLYLQVGIIGHENYVRDGKPDMSKLVYGRKWRIDTDTPTSEIVQTVLLAVQKVREHEVRELLTWTDPENNVPTTPFSCHQDINLLTLHFNNSTTNIPSGFDRVELDEIIKQIRIDKRELVVENVINLDFERILIDMRLSPLENFNNCFYEIGEHNITVIVHRFSVSGFMHELMDCLIGVSNKYCQDNFRFCGVSRFSRDRDPRIIGDISRKSRPYKEHMADMVFSESFERVNSVIDRNRAPRMGNDMLANINKNKISKISELGGYMPNGY